MTARGVVLRLGLFLVGFLPLLLIGSALLDDGGDERRQPIRRGAAEFEAPLIEPGLELVARHYDPGDCVLWEQDDRLSLPVDVDCADPHLFEVVGDAEFPGDGDYPSDAEWFEWADAGPCLELARSYLAQPYTAFPSLHIGFIRPTHEGWIEGERGVTCGLEGWIGSTGAGSTPISGRAVDLLGQPPWVAGTCLDRSLTTIDCAEPHVYQLVGYVELGPEEPYPDDARVDGIANDDCWPMVASYVGPGAVNPEILGWVQTPGESSWALGARMVACFVVEAGTDLVPRVRAGSLAG
jgi:hypothetical protein